MTKVVNAAFSGFLAATLRPLDGADHTISAEERRGRWAEETWSSLSGRDRAVVAEGLVDAGIVDASSILKSPRLRRRSHARAEAIWRSLSPGAQFGVALVVERIYPVHAVELPHITFEVRYD
jgi:hypothetical protein